MPRPAGSRNKPKVAYYCDECGETGFATRKCPGCGNLKTLELNKDGIPLTEVQNAIGAQPQMPITLGMAPDFMDPNAEMKKLVSDEQSQAIAEMNLDKVKAKAAEAKAERIRTEEELALTEKGFRKPKAHPDEQHDPMMQQQQRTIGMDPAMLLQGIGKWTAEDKKDLFDRLQDDDFALNFSRTFNSMPQQQMPMNQQMMNPWMNPMMMGQQPQAPPEPQESAASMMTAVIAAVAQIQELSGGSDDGSAAMDRMMDRMERMEERQSERDTAMQQRILEMQQSQQNNGVSPHDVQQMIHSTIANSSTDQLAASIESINGVVSGLQSLGVVKRADVDATNVKDDFDRMKWKDEVDLKREDRVREDAREVRAADLELSRQASEMSVMGLLLGSNQSIDDVDDDSEDSDEESPAVSPMQRVVG